MSGTLFGTRLFLRSAGLITCCLISWLLYASIFTKQQDSKYWISDDSQFFAMYIV